MANMAANPARLLVALGIAAIRPMPLMALSFGWLGGRSSVVLCDWLTCRIWLG